MRRKKSSKKTGESENENHLTRTIEDLAANGYKKKKPKEVLGFRCDSEIKAEAESIFGDSLATVLQAALQQAIKDSKKYPSSK